MEGIHVSLSTFATFSGTVSTTKTRSRHDKSLVTGQRCPRGNNVALIAEESGCNPACGTPSVARRSTQSWKSFDWSDSCNNTPHTCSIQTCPGLLSQRVREKSPCSADKSLPSFLALQLPDQVMGPPRWKLQETIDATLTPPDDLADGQSIARVVKAEGNNLYSVELPSAKSLLVELPARFRSTIWLKRDGFIVVDAKALADRDNKLDGEIVNVVRDERQWRKERYWPKEFVKRPAAMVSNDEESTVGKMPPSDDEEGEEERSQTVGDESRVDRS